METIQSSELSMVSRSLRIYATIGISHAQGPVTLGCQREVVAAAIGNSGQALEFAAGVQGGGVKLQDQWIILVKPDRSVVAKKTRNRDNRGSEGRELREQQNGIEYSEIDLNSQFVVEMRSILNMAWVYFSAHPLWRCEISELRLHGSFVAYCVASHWE